VGCTQDCYPQHASQYTANVMYLCLLPLPRLPFAPLPLITAFTHAFCPSPLPPPVQVLGRQCGRQGWPGEQVVVIAAAKRYIRAAIKLAARGQFSKKEGE
jgi:hypothetical protein